MAIINKSEPLQDLIGFLEFFRDNIERFVIRNSDGSINGITVKSDLILSAEKILHGYNSCTSCNMSWLATELMKKYFENKDKLNGTEVRQQRTTASKEGQTKDSGRSGEGKKTSGKTSKKQS